MSVLGRSYSGPYFPALGLNTDRYGVRLNNRRSNSERLLHGKEFVQYLLNCHALVKTILENLIMFYSIHEKELQWNLSKADTYGTEVFVDLREVSALEMFELKSSQI